MIPSIRRPGIRAAIRTAVASVAVLSAPAPLALAAQGVPSAPGFREVLSLASVGGVALSPDGSTVAYTVRTTDWEENGYDTEIWIAPESTEPYQLTRTPDGSSGSPAWSSDGRWIAFTADRGDGRQVHLVDPRGGEAWAATSLEEGVTGYAWAPHGRRLALTVPNPAQEGEEQRTDSYGAFEVDGEPGPDSHLWVVDVDERGRAGEPRRLTEGAFHVTSFEWSPSGDEIVFARAADSNLLSGLETQIDVVEVRTGVVRSLVDGPGPDGAPTYSPDGEWVLFAEFDGDLGSVYYLNRELARIPAAGGEIEILTRGFDETVGFARWTEAGIRFAAGDRTRRVIYTLDPETREVSELALPTAAVGAWDFTRDGGALAFTGSSGTSLPEVFRAWGGTAAGVGIRLHDAEYAQLTDLTSQTAGWPVGTSEVITWRSEDAMEIEGVLYKPDDFDPARRYPLLVQIHGGPTGTSRPSLVHTYVYPTLHWLARGALVLQPNYRGSAGYGEAFRSLNVRNLGVGDMWDVMSGVEHLVDLGIADPERLGAMGWSQGGYISAFLATHTDAFRAISVGAGISNWMTYYVNTDIHPFTRQYLKATPWSDPDIYARTSPITNVVAASTPTLIQHGEFDERVPIPNAYELYQGLQDVGVESRLIVYKGFGHGITRPKELLAAVWHNWQWFGRHIWGEEIELPLEDDSAGAGAPPR